MDVGAVGFLADSVEVQFSKEPFEVLVALAAGWTYGKPRRLWLG